MKVITTSYLDPTNTLGSRYKATDNDGNQITVSTDFRVSTLANHKQVAIALLAKMGWDNEEVIMHGGWQGSRMVFVFDNEHHGEMNKMIHLNGF